MVVPNQTHSDNSTDELVEELQALCAPRQRALLSFIAISKKHGLDVESVLGCLSSDLSRTPLESRRNTRYFYWSRVLDFATRLKKSSSQAQALAESHPPMLPQVVDLSLRVEEESGRLEQFENAWLQRSALPSPHYKETGIARLFPFMIKIWFVFGITLKFLGQVVRQFKEMLEEFELESNLAMSILIQVAEIIDRLWPLALLIALLIPLCFLPWVFGKLWFFGRGMNPFIWQQPFLPASLEKRKALSFLRRLKGPLFGTLFRGLFRLQRLLRIDYGFQEEIPFDNLLDQTFPQTAKQFSSNEAAKETQAWVLSRSANSVGSKQQSRSEFWLNTFIFVMNLFLAAIVLLASVTVFSVLVAVIEKYAL